MGGGTSSGGEWVSNVGGMEVFDPFGYHIKMKWYNWSERHPITAEVVKDFVINGPFHGHQQSSDIVLNSGIHIEGKYYRVAELVGLVEDPDMDWEWYLRGGGAA